MTDIVSVPRLDPVYTAITEDAENAVKEIQESKDFERGVSVIQGMLEYVKAVDDSVGIVLNGMNEIWNPDEHDGERFEQFVERKTGLKPVTVQRHVKIRKAFPSIPEEYRDEIQDKGFKEKIQIAQLVDGGYEVTETDWRDLAEAVDEKEVGRIARKIKGVEPRTNWLAISIDDKGVLRVHTSRNVREVGRLNTWDDDVDVQKAISRMIGCTGVQPASEY